MNEPEVAQGSKRAASGRPVRCVLVGVGMMGVDHAAILAASPSAELVACVDIDPAAAGRVPSRVPFMTSIDEALAIPDLDALFVCTPQAFHEDGVRRGLERGLHVFCEKPIAHSLASADAIIHLAERHPGRLAIGHMYRFDPRWMAIHEAVSNGRLGRLVHLSLRGYTPDFEGVMLAGRTTLANENAVHGLDLLRWLAGDLQRVYAEESRTGVAGAGLVDSIAVTIRFTSGAIGVVETDWAMPTDTGLGSEQHFSAVGSEGVAWIDLRDAGVGIFSRQAAPSFPRGIVYADPAGGPQGIYRVEDEYFLALVRDGRPWPIALSDARAALQAALAVDRSIELERPVRLDELT